MAKASSGGFTASTGFSRTSSSPLDDSLLVEFLSDLHVIERPYPLMTVGVLQTKKKYTWNGEDITRIENWSTDSADLHYSHDQGVPSAVWNIQHNLNKNPSAIVTDTAGTVVIGQIEYIDLNNIVITFNASFSGTAYIN